MNVETELEKFYELKKKFEEIKKMGWIKSCCKGLGGIGNTFEQLLDINQNEFEIPDYNGIEIKTKRAFSHSNTSLFNCVPDGPHYHEIERLKDCYGYPDSDLKKYRVLSASVNTKDLYKVGLFFYFKLKVDREKRKIFLQVFGLHGNLKEECVYWDFDTLEEKLYRKLKYLAFARAYVKKNKDSEFFKYYKITFYKLKDFDTFIELIDQGCIRITFKIGIYKWGVKEGKIHDHGTSFNISEDDFEKLYDLIEI